MADSAAIVVADPEALVSFHVPEASALAMVESCARQLAEVSTIPDILKLVTQADAISAVMQKIKASEKARKAALRLRIEAEAHLGRITAQIPLGKRGGAATPDQRTKAKVLAEHGIHKYRAGVAERLAKTPAVEVEAAIDRAKTNGVYGVMQDLGLRKPWRDYQMPEVVARNLGYLAEEAVSLLERHASAKTAPHAGTVAEMRNRLTRLRTKAD